MDPTHAEGGWQEADDGREREDGETETPGEHGFPRLERVVVERPGEYGGDVSFGSYGALADALESGELHPADAKSALTSYLDRLVAPGREKIREQRT